MSSLCHKAAFAIVLFALAAGLGFAQPKKPLRICADPDNPPFSSRVTPGFDNRIASLIAHDLGRKPVFIWTRERRGFMREQFNRNVCDILMGVPSGMKSVTTTVPYYRSSYVFVTRRSDHLQLVSFSDPQLNGLRIGLQVLEEDYSPPSLPLIHYGHAAQLVGFPSFGAAAGDIVRAVADGRIGVAVVWGPLAGYFAALQKTPLSLTPVSPQIDLGIPFVFSVCVGLHKQDTVLRGQINASLSRLHRQIQRILAEYHVPVLTQKEAAS
jgi:mxaJ protein